ncbi:MAG: hypothetical protein P8166_16365 [Candidatus Thiodiazotropha sp.]
MDYRIILYHNQATSARTRFLKFAHESVCAFEPIPMPAQVLEQEDAGNMVNHPAAILQDVERRLALPAGCLKAEGEYRHSVEVPGRSIQILLVCITTMDPPFEEAEKVDAQFIDLTQARGLPGVENARLRVFHPPGIR